MNKLKPMNAKEVKKLMYKKMLEFSDKELIEAIEKAKKPLDEGGYLDSDKGGNPILRLTRFAEKLLKQHGAKE